MGTEHQTAQQDRRQQQHYRKQPTEREQMKLKSNNHPTIAQNEHWKARQPHLGRTFPEVQTGPTSDRNEADYERVGGNFIFTSKIATIQDRNAKRRLQPTNRIINLKGWCIHTTPTNFKG